MSESTNLGCCSSNNENLATRETRVIIIGSKKILFFIHFFPGLQE